MKEYIELSLESWHELALLTATVTLLDTFFPDVDLDATSSLHINKM